MGGYTKLIVNCSVSSEKTTQEYKEEVLGQLGGLGTSAYHCEGELLEVFSSTYKDEEKHISLITQQKYGRGISEFLGWLKPQVTQGMGADGIFAFEVTEYDGGLTIHKMDKYLK